MNCEMGEESYFSCPVRLSSIIGRPAIVPSRPVPAMVFFITVDPDDALG